MKNSNYVAKVIASAVLIVASGLAYADDAVTNWIVVVNYPEACSSMPCTEEDIFGSLPDNPTQATVCFLTGQHVRNSGKAAFSGRLGEGTSHGCFFPMDPNPLGLKDAMRAEIHAILQNHGDPVTGARKRGDQLTENGVWCNPNCTDFQFSTHVAADAVNGISRSPMQLFADGSPVDRSISVLFRDKEGIRMYNATNIYAAPPQ